MSLRHAILGLLNYKNMTGYEIDRHFKSAIAFFWHAQTSQIYKELTTLMKYDLVDCEMVYQDDKPNKKIFHITDKGRLELDRWLSNTDISDIMKYKNPLLVKIFFASEMDVDQTMRLLEKYIKECSEIIDQMNEDVNKIGEYEKYIERENESFYWGMTMTYGFMYYQNEIKWANWCIDKLKEKIK